MKREKIILASASPRRIEMMKNKGFDPEIMPSAIKEKLPLPMTKETAVMYLALKKALDVETRVEINDSPLIIAADTIVYDDRIIGKPKDEREAFATLSRLSGRSHYVLTGVALILAGTQARQVFYESSTVTFKSYSSTALRAYVKTEEPYDKAGGYAIQGTFSQYVDHIDGDVENVIGFPWSRIEREIQKQGWA
jgi:septum formation protein